MTVVSRVMAQTGAEETDEALAVAARQGDREAFALLAARYREIAFAYAFARLHHRDEAEDAVQEAFVRAYQALPRFRPAGCWGAWMMRILRNHCTDLLRRRRGRVMEPLEEDWADRTPTPEIEFLAKARCQELAAAVTALPEKYQTPLRMHYASRRTYREIALALDLPESTVIGRMAGALRLLRRRLGQEEGR